MAHSFSIYGTRGTSNLESEIDDSNLTSQGHYPAPTHDAHN